MNTKCNVKAEKIRLKGCQELINGELYEALLKFNKSLCLAEPLTKTSAQIFANRSEVYFKLKLFEKCLNNIQLSRDECSQVKIESLDELEEKCLNQIGDALDENENPWEFFKLSYPANKKLPNVIENLQVKCDNKFGRYIITNQDLKIGDIIGMCIPILSRFSKDLIFENVFFYQAIEPPFFKILKFDPNDDEYPESNKFQYCANCLNDNLMDLIPCAECVVTMFCSPNCRREANKGFHQYECNILNFLNQTGNWRMPLRCFFDALTICCGCIEELERVMQVCENSSPTVFNFDFSNLKSFKNKQYHLLCMLSLTNNVAVNIHDFSHLFQHHPKLEELWSTHRSFIEKFLQRMMQVEILNFHGIKGRSLNRNKPYRPCLGDGGYPFCSLINHSCCPNVMRIVVENRMVLVVERPIKKGEQLFDCYIG
jgi:SET and MYND domain-containing protein 4